MEGCLVVSGEAAELGAGVRSGVALQQLLAEPNFRAVDIVHELLDHRRHAVGIDRLVFVGVGHIAQISSMYCLVFCCAAVLKAAWSSPLSRAAP
jgi:hypothetical protein